MKALYYLAPFSIALALATSASAQEIYSTGFEPTEDPPFVLGDITGQDGWFVAPGAAEGIIQDSVVASGVQALEVIDAASFGRAQRSIATSAILPVFASSYSMYVPSEWAAIPTEVLDRFEAQQRLEFTTTAGEPLGIEFGFLTTSIAYDVLEPGQSAIYIELTVADMVQASAFAPIARAPFLDEWHRFDLTFDVSRGTIELAVDGGPALSLGGATDAINVSVVQLQNQRWGTSPRFTESLYFDDLHIEARGGCYADCDGNGELEFLDFLCFQDAFAAGEPYADCDASTEIDFLDFLCFQNAFAAACP